MFVISAIAWRSIPILQAIQTNLNQNIGIASYTYAHCFEKSLRVCSKIGRIIFQNKGYRKAAKVEAKILSKFSKII
jgi:hypothetical protein